MAPPPPSASRRRTTVDTWTIVIALVGLYCFAHSFFLAKRSLSLVSDCHEAATLLQESLGLSLLDVSRAQRQGGLADAARVPRQGCWMNRRIDSLIILVVDALRFDFCLYNLPKSVGARLSSSEGNTNSNSFFGMKKTDNQTRLFRFVADPPTVTVQRLKALTTGGLPTFADLSANFGGATVEDDSWVQQLVRLNQHKNLYQARGLSVPSRAGFVGDDTWDDLYPGYFAECHPYPSFNTRDLDTVDNGCLLHLPNMTSRIRRKGRTQEDELEVIVVHFLGVDHVGHTYGPHNEHMDVKLKQMDDALSQVLDQVDDDTSSACHAVFIFGDHGMTEDGNHGGGTEEEISAALFVHTSAACGDMSDAIGLERETSSSSPWWSDTPFASIHQIDLVPTLSILLGLPLPYANLGSLVPSLIPGQTAAETATALALNAAQVWRYLNQYSATANRLPNLDDLQRHLQAASEVYQDALQESDRDYQEKYQQASALFKHFLALALELGQRVWTRFDTVGMVCGITVLALSLVSYALPLVGRDSTTPAETRSQRYLPRDQYWELAFAGLFMVFQCGLLTFSNSYILEEENVIMYALAVICIAVAVRMQGGPTPTPLWRGVLLLPVASRLNELFVHGHGLDPLIRMFMAHNSVVFLSSLLVLAAFRWKLYKMKAIASLVDVVVDIATLACLAASWWEKRDTDPERNGFWPCRVALVLLFVGIPISIFLAITRKSEKIATSRTEGDMLSILFKLLTAIMMVTGPSTSTSAVLFLLQAAAVYFLSRTAASTVVHNFVLAAIWRLVTRHIFFATNHGCAFNRLQYSAAFIATKQFYFVTGGISLFLNTFGWEIMGLAGAYMFSRHAGRSDVWRIYTTFQLLEALTSCISVSLLRRHLMVWDVYAPHFLFSAIFAILNGVAQLIITGLSIS